MVSTDGTAASEDMHGRMQFMTTSDGAGSPTERMRINQNGRVNISRDGANITANPTGTSLAVTDGDFYHGRTSTSNGCRVFVKFFQYNKVGNGLSSGTLLLLGFTS